MTDVAKQPTRLYLITEKELLRLQETAEYYWALEAGGVDNWENYGDSLADYLDATGLPPDYFDRERKPTTNEHIKLYVPECEGLDGPSVDDLLI